jgi:c-di-GMP-binding flagellar brake protein YcgR
MSLEHKQHPWTLPRAHSRFLLDLRLVVRAKETLHGRTKDIAEGGLGATIPGEIEIGEIVELELQLHETAELLKLKAEVRYRRGFQYGFKFLHATEQQRELIRRATHDLRLAP